MEAEDVRKRRGVVMERTAGWAGLAAVLVVVAGCERVGEWVDRQGGFAVPIDTVRRCDAPQGVAALDHDPKLAAVFSSETEAWFERRDGGVVGCDAATGELRRALPAASDGKSNESLALRRGRAEFVLARDGETRTGPLPKASDARVLDLPGGGGASALAPDGRIVLRADGSSTLWLAANDGSARQELAAERPVAYRVDVAGDTVVAVTGEYEPTTGHDTRVRTWSVEDGTTRVLPALERHPVIGVWVALLSDDGRRLVADTQKQGRSGVVMLDLETGRVVFEKTDVDSFWTRAIALSPDESRIATGDEKGYIRLYDVASGEQIGERPTFDVVDSLAFSPDGTKLAAGLAGGRLLVFRLGPEA